MRSSRNLIHAALVVGFALAVLASFTFIGTYQELIDIAPRAGLRNALKLMGSRISTVWVLGASLYAVWLNKFGIVVHKEEGPAIVLALVFGFISVFGPALTLGHMIQFLFATRTTILATCLSSLVLSVFWYSLLQPIFKTIKAQGLFVIGAGNSSNRGSLQSRTKGENFLPEAHNWGHPAFFALVPLFLFVSWLPYIVAFAPGNLCYDMDYQLGQYMGEAELTTHHPLAATFLYGSLFSLGRFLIGSDNGGLFCLMIVQSVALAFACSFQLRCIRMLSDRLSITCLSLAFFCFAPMIGPYTSWIVKDSLFCSAFLVYMSLFALCIRYPKAFGASRVHLAALVFFSAATALLRNNGLYIVLLSLPFLVLRLGNTDDGFSFKSTLRRALPLVLVVCCIAISNSALTASTGAKSGSIREALSLPIQQTALYITRHGDDVQPWEHDAIEQVFEYDSITERYRWYSSDPIKNRFNDNGSLLVYVRAWASMGLRHPLTYFDAMLAHTYGYWVLEQGNQSYPQRHYAGMDGAFTSREWVHWDYFIGNPHMREVADSYAPFVRNIPFLGLFADVGIYTLMLLFLLAFLLRYGTRFSWILFLPAMVMLLTCLAGPINGAMRYALGYVVSMPLLVVVSLSLIGNRSNRDAATVTRES